MAANASSAVSRPSWLWLAEPFISPPLDEHDSALLKW